MKKIKSMAVEVKYPENFPLKGWDKALFGIRVSSMFKQGWVSISDLDDWRKSAGLGEAVNETDKKARDDLQQLHCVSFRKLPVEVLSELPARVGRYIGVDLYSISRPRVLPALSIVGPFALVAALAFFAGRLAHSASESDNTVALHPNLPSLSSNPMPLEPLSPVDASSAEPVFSASVTTATPRQSLRHIAEAIPASGGKFDVSVTVAPSADGSK